MDIAVGAVLLLVFIIVVRQLIHVRLPASDPLKKSAEALIDKWAQERQYRVMHKSFIERQWGAEKRLFYEVFLTDAENQQPNGVAVCVFSNDNPEHGRVDMVWK